jgi:hypothetical protein
MEAKATKSSHTNAQKPADTTPHPAPSGGEEARNGAAAATAPHDGTTARPEGTSTPDTTANASPSEPESNPPGASPLPAPKGDYTAKARSFSRFRLAQNFDEVAGVSKVIVNVNVVKPGPQVWFRVHPDEAYRLPVALLNLKDENETFVVDPSIADQLAAEIVPHILFTYVTRQGVVGIWPVRMPRSDGRTDGWMRSSHEAAQLGTTRWVRLQANRSGGAYDVNVTKAQLPEPEWPDMTFERLLEIAFTDHIIESLDHPVLRRLRGEI